MAIEVTDADFQSEVLDSKDLVLVDFWAQWCGPCKQLLPTIEQISDERSDNLKVVKVNIDDNPEAPSKHGVRSIPTLMLFKGGEHLSTKVGALPKSTIEEWIDSAA